MNHAKSKANHVPTADTYADAAARLAATGFPRGEDEAIVAFELVDVGKFARQSDDNSIWMLIDESPITWLAIGAFSPAFEALTDGATITWAFGNERVKNATVTLGGNRTLSITGALNGANGVLIVKQDATGTRTLTLPAGSKVVGGGAGAVTLTGTANAIDVLSFYYDGTNYFWTYGQNFT